MNVCECVRACLSVHGWVCVCQRGYWCHGVRLCHGVVSVRFSMFHCVCVSLYMRFVRHCMYVGIVVRERVSGLSVCQSDGGCVSVWVCQYVSLWNVCQCYEYSHRVSVCQCV